MWHHLNSVFVIQISYLQFTVIEYIWSYFFNYIVVSTCRLGEKKNPRAHELKGSMITGRVTSCDTQWLDGISLIECTPVPDQHVMEWVEESVNDDM